MSDTFDFNCPMCGFQISVLPTPSVAVREVVADIRLVRNWFAAVERCGTPITLTPEQVKVLTTNLADALDRLAKEVNRE